MSECQTAQPEVEVTPLMIKAGADVLRTYLACGADYADLAALVFEAMTTVMEESAPPNNSGVGCQGRAC
jgi:hypothetical protein